MLVQLPPHFFFGPVERGAVVFPFPAADKGVAPGDVQPDFSLQGVGTDVEHYRGINRPVGQTAQPVQDFGGAA